MAVAVESELSSAPPRVRGAASYSRSPTLYLVLGVLHGLLALAYRTQPQLGVPHALAVATFGLVVAVRRPHEILPTVAYLAGVEMLWRMNQVPVPYEIGKLLGTTLLLIALVSGARRLQTALVFLLAAALLLPAISLTLDLYGFTLSARRAISFELAGPMMLTIGAAALSALPSFGNLNRVLAAFSVPVIGLGVFVLYNTMTATSIRYSTSSNFATSGGFGPVQVSLVLALGAVAVFVLATATPRLSLQVLFFSLSTALLAISVFTFSRNGLYCAAVAIVALVARLALTGYRARRWFFALAFILTIGLTVLFPKLDSFTDGQLVARYAEVTPTVRLELIRSDLNTFWRHPLTGVGVGVSRFHRDDPQLVGFLPHTEFSRLLAEHGIAGLAVLLILGGGWLYAALGREGVWNSAIVTATGAASVVAMSANSLRLAATPLFFILAFSQIQRVHSSRRES